MLPAPSIATPDRRGVNAAGGRAAELPHGDKVAIGVEFGEKGIVDDRATGGADGAAEVGVARAVDR